MFWYEKPAGPDSRDSQMRIDPSWLEKDKSTFFLPAGTPYRILFWAIILLLLLLTGTIYLLMIGPLAESKMVGLAERPTVRVVVADYQGPLWGIEKMRQQVKEQLKARNLIPGNPITIFPQSPERLRPLHVSGRVGYILQQKVVRPPLLMPMRLEIIQPGKCLVVRVTSQGNFTGLAAMRPVQKALRTQKVKMRTSERYEVKIKSADKAFVEHWLPVD